MSRKGPAHRGTGEHDHDIRWCGYCASFEDGVRWAAAIVEKHVNKDCCLTDAIHLTDCAEAIAAEIEEGL